MDKVSYKCLFIDVSFEKSARENLRRVDNVTSRELKGTVPATYIRMF